MSVISTPAASAASAMFCSVVVPALTHTTAPPMSLICETDVNPSPARAMSCFPS